MKTFNIVLYEPEIPQNTGNIARLCACTGANLYLVGKLGFALTDKYTKRAGLDYWDSVNITKVNSLEDLYQEGRRFFYLTTKVKNTIYEAEFRENDFLVFGPETRGLPEDLLKSVGKNAITIPMREGQRSLNLSNSVSIVLYEAIRQTGFC